MRAKTFLQIFLSAFLIAGCIQYSSSRMASREKTKLAESLCQMAGNFLEVGSLREAYEAIEAGLVRSGYPGACVSVIDNGRSYATNCMDPGRSYQTSLCRAQGNVGVRAEVHFLEEPLAPASFFRNWVIIAAAIALLLMLYQRLAQRLLAEISEEFRNRLLISTPQTRVNPGSSRMGLMVDLFLNRSGVLKDVRGHVE